MEIQRKALKLLRKQFRKIAVLRVLTFTLGLILLVHLLFSLFWRMEHDIPLLNYVAFLMNEHGLMVYKDIFATSMPGTFIFHVLYTKLFGYSDFGYRLCDMLFLMISLLGIYLLLRKIDTETAVFACVIWGIYHLNMGETVGLQKDYVGLLPLIFASALLLDKNKANPHYFFIGLFLACSFWVKPHLLVWLLPAAIYFFYWERETISIRQLGIGTAGFLSLTLLVILWLYSQNALIEWLNIFLNYIPLHVQLNGTHEVLSGWAEKIHYNLMELVDVFIYYPSNFILISALIWIFFRRDLFPGDNTVRYLLLNSITFYLYPAIAGQFWLYHWIPFFFFAITGVTLLFYIIKKQAKPWVPVLLLIAFTIFLIRDTFILLYPDRTEKARVVDDLTSWIRNNTKPEDTIQPLDWSAGALHSMLLTKRKIATKYLYDYHFYHHISNETIQALREDFIKEIKQKEPAYFILMHGKPTVSGHDTSSEFPQLKAILRNNYSLVFLHKNFTIYKKAFSHQFGAKTQAPVTNQVLFYSE